MNKNDNMKEIFRGGGYSRKHILILPLLAKRTFVSH